MSKNGRREERSLIYTSRNATKEPKSSLNKTIKGRPIIYMATIVPGLESLLINEISNSFCASIIMDKQRGKVFFEYKSSFQDLFSLKCADNLYLFLGTFHIGPHKADLNLLSSSIRRLNIVFKMKAILSTVANRKIIVSASRVGKQTYSRFDIAQVAMEALLSCCPFTRGSIERHDFAFRLDVVNDLAYLFYKLTSSSFRYRTLTRQFVSGALRPTIAHAMIRLSEPNPADIFLDPFCGSGTIPNERFFYDASSIMACDSSDERIAIARANLPAKINVFICDARHTGLPNESITKIVTNPPWDMQIGVDNVESLYAKFLFEAKRILKPEGRIILLTTRESELLSAADKNNLDIKKMHTLSLHGQHPSIFMLWKKE